MRKFVVGLALLSLMLSNAGSLASARTHSDKEALVQRFYWYEELLASANSEDVIAMQTNDFVNAALNMKEMTREQSDAMVRINVDQVYRVYGANVRINTLKINGDRATVVFTQYFNSDNRDSSGQVYRVISNFIARQQWVKTEDGWKVKRTRTLRGYVTLDGQRIL